MKFLKINIHNLASIEDAEIDFNGNVLRDEPIFLITGTTGAGKSTILDAICLALFNETPRFAEAAEKNVKLTDRYNAATGKNVKDKDFKAGEQVISLNHKGQLLRRGAAEGWVELRFEAEGVEYLAKWYVKRKYGRADGKLDTPHNTFTNIDTGHVEENTRAIKEVEKIVGLTFDEFCRTTMLAQGDFTRFLQSSSKDKSVILEKLTRTMLYSEIGKKIFELKSLHTVEHERKKALLEGISLFTEEERDAMVKEEEELKVLSEVYVKELDICEKKRKWLLTDRQLVSDMEEKRETLQRKKEVTESEDFKKESRMVADFDATTEPRTWLADMEHAKLHIRRLKDEEPQMVKQYAKLVAASRQLEQAQKSDEQALEKLETWMGERKAHMAMFHKAQTITFRLQQVQADEDSVKKMQRVLKEAKERLPVVERRIEESQQKEMAALVQLRQKNNEVDETIKQREAYDRKGLMEKSKSLSEKKDDIRKAKNDISLLDTKHMHLEETERAFKKLVEEKDRLEKEHPTLKEKMEWSRELHDHAKEAYDNVRLSLDESFKAVRATLRKGMTCPLCMKQVEHDHVPDPDYDTCIRPLLQAEKDSRIRLEKAMADLEANRLMKGKVEKLLVEAGKNWDNARKQFDIQAEMVWKGMEKLLGSAPDMAMASRQWLEQLGRLEEQVEKELAELKKRLDEVESIGRQLEQMMREEQKLTKKHAEAQAATEEVKHQKEQLLADVDAANLKKKELLANINETIGILRKDISWTGWEMEWEGDHAIFIKRLNDQADAFAQAEQRKSFLSQVITTRRMTLEGVGQSKDDVEALVPGWSGMSKGAYETGASEVELPRLWQNFTKKVNTWKTSIANREEDHRKKEEMVGAFIESQPAISFERLVDLAACDKEEVEAVRRRHGKLDANIRKDEGALAELKHHWERHHADKPLFKEEETGEWLKEKAEELNARYEKTLLRMGQLEQQLQEDQEKQQKYAHALAECQESRKLLDQWERLDKELGGSDGSRFSRVAQSFILNHLLSHANKYLARFTNRYELVCEPGALAILVRDRFSRQSPQFSKILSGGESFMVSLSLALALAKLNTHQSSVDTLFIDEGFGTLDEECLNTVMDTLEQLHQMGGHRVGVISHVEALKERIHAQVQVKRVDPSRSKVEVIRT